MKTHAEIQSQTPRVSVIVVMYLYCLISFVSARPSQASYACYFDAFTSNGGYCDDDGMNMYVVMTGGAGIVEFTFYNESLFESSIAGIYFDNGSLGDISSVINGPGTSFIEDFSGPENLPAAMLLSPPFQADSSIRAEAAIPLNGVNSPISGEWVRVSFALPAGGTLEGIAGELNSGQMRIGLHIISLPDGSSESAVSTPEPATICLLGIGGLSLIRKRRQ